MTDKAIEIFKAQNAEAKIPAEFLPQIDALTRRILSSASYRAAPTIGEWSDVNTAFAIAAIIEAAIEGRSAVRIDGARHDLASAILAEITA